MDRKWHCHWKASHSGWCCRSQISKIIKTLRCAREGRAQSPREPPAQCGTRTHDRSGVECGCPPRRSDTDKELESRDVLGLSQTSYCKIQPTDDDFIATLAWIISRVENAFLPKILREEFWLQENGKYGDGLQEKGLCKEILKEKAISAPKHASEFIFALYVL